LAGRKYSNLHDLYSTSHLLIIWLLSNANMRILDMRTYFYFGSRLLETSIWMIVKNMKRISSMGFIIRVLIDRIM